MAHSLKRVTLFVNLSYIFSPFSFNSVLDYYIMCQCGTRYEVVVLVTPDVTERGIGVLSNFDSFLLSLFNFQFC